MTQAFNLSQLANKVNTSGQLDVSTGVTGTLPVANLANSGVTAGSYTATNITVDAKGRVTAASNSSGGVTSLNGQTGAITNTNLYAIGSYVTGRPANTTTYAIDGTLAGSSLYAVSQSLYWNGSGWANQYIGIVITTTPATLVNTGTWRCVTAAVRLNTSGAAYPGLWVRIS
jgi:hypothetical protein